MNNDSKNQGDIFKNQPALIVLVVLIVGVGIGYLLQKSPTPIENSNQSTEVQDIQNVQQTSTEKVFYTISNVNVRKCAFLSCDVVGQYPLNTDLPLPYNSLAEMPEWIQISWIDAGNTIFGYINKKVLSESRTQIVEKVIEKQPVGLSSIIKYWRPRVAYIECIWQYSDTKQVYQEASGSGLAMKYSDGTIAIVTNKHVLSDDNGYGPNKCVAKLPDSNSIYEVNTNNIKWNSGSADWGYLAITAPDSHIKDIVGQDLNYCQKKASIGDSVVVLGYPSYGTDYLDITATEGIISGYDREYYTTSAKIEHGNSGGVSVLEKDNCYLGIPTGVRLGEFESLGRILDVKNIFQ